MIKSSLMSVHHVEDYPGGTRLKELDFNDGDTWAAPFKAGIVTVPPAATTPMDEHAMRECWVVISGRGELISAGETVQLEPGSVTYFQSQRPHQLRNVGDQELKLFSVWWNAHG
ncbi:cupin domain-containing protein [Bradyrhizobium prioriisuperbiae]|uniref:cupin domain-containing protein n=1 Tax=Bradyrhizobium prioriisuperbiae TaxID=2854389 RepID=UPI0028EF13DC|nr:cupin domain-containing protein [Bradyrhizobium prioritasuperba]